MNAIVLSTGLDYQSGQVTSFCLSYDLHFYVGTSNVVIEIKINNLHSFTN
jgi:hypothetical protein